MKEETVAIIKPDGVMMGMDCEIVARYEALGLTVKRREARELSMSEASNFYAEHLGKHFFAGLVLAMSSGPSVLLVLEGDNAVAAVRALNGPTNPSNAPAGTIRRDFLSAGGPFNTVHGSDSVESAQREMKVLFK